MSTYDDRHPYDRRSEDQRTLEALDKWIEAGHRYLSPLDVEDRRTALETMKFGMGQLHDKAHEISVELHFKRTIPVPWIHDTPDAAVIAKLASPALARTAAECADGKRNVVLLGKTGTGKTATAALLARNHYRLQRRREQHFGYRFSSVDWMYARDIVAAVLAHPLGKGEAPTLDKARNARILVIDDLGLEKDHGPILDVLHERNQQNRVTWITSGLTVDQIKERYGEAVYRRLVEMNGTMGRVVSCFGKPTLQAVGR